MEHLYRRFTTEQLKVLLQGYCQGSITRAEAQEVLAIGKTRFLALLQEYGLSPLTFSIAYERDTPVRLPASTESVIVTELRREQRLVEDRRLPISDYNYSTVRDRCWLEMSSVDVAVTLDGSSGKPVIMVQTIENRKPDNLHFLLFFRK